MVTNAAAPELRCIVPAPIFGLRQGECGRLECDPVHRVSTHPEHHDFRVQVNA